MPRIYKALTALLAVTGCAGLFITGPLNPVMLIPALGLIPGYVRLWKDMPAAQKWIVSSLSISALFFFAFDALIITGDLFIAVAHLTVVFQAIKSFDLKEPWDHLQVYFMSLLQLIIASELTRSIVFGAVFIIFLIALVTAMVISHFLKEGTFRKIKLKMPVTVISILTLLTTGMFFISAPRVKGGIVGKSRMTGIKTAGFSEKVNFGSFGEVKLDSTIVMRVEMPEKAPTQLYWRGMTLDYFDGTSWLDTIKKRNRVSKYENIFVFLPASLDNAIMQRIFIEPIDSDVIFGLGSIAGIEIDIRAMFTDSAGAVFVPEKSPKRLAYTAYSVLEEQPASDNIPYYLQFPSGLEKTGKLSGEITKNSKTDIEKASKIENYLKTNYKYSLKISPPAAGINPIENFLFSSKAGYCEHYATAMALMLRHAGIPSRIVTGFAGGERNKYGGYIIVRQSDAHSWVEAVIDGRWKRLDPTPPAPQFKMPSLPSLYIDSLRLKWYRYVVNFSSSDQKNLIRYFSMPFVKMPKMLEIRIDGLKAIFYIFLIAGFIAITIFLLSRIKIRRYGFVTAYYLRFRRHLKRKGAKITASSTPSDIAEEASKLGMSEKAFEFIRLYEMARFGGKELSSDEKERYTSLNKKI
jgi:transglutaminase-like putative cysteine protease